MRTKELARKYKDYTIEMRREFHKYPEPSLEEYRTSKRIKEELEKMGIEAEICGDTGVVGIIKGEKEGKTVALRADIDALAVPEETGKDYASTVPGLMHACGHDTHAAMLLGAAQILKDMKDEIEGTVKLFFQPGEEVGKGALKMIKDGALEGVDSVFGIHISTEIPIGQISIDGGPRNASADSFKIKIIGKGGHGSRPDQCIDSVVVGSAMVMNLQTIISREFTPLLPAVLTVGSFNSGSRFNVIAPTAILEGTTRCYDLKIWEEFPKSMERVIKATAETYRADVEFEYTRVVGPTINDEEIAKLARDSARKIFGEGGIVSKPASTGAEDFSEFANRVPGAIAYLGARNAEKGADYPHHHEKFEVDEDSFELGSGIYAQYAMDYLKS